MTSLTLVDRAASARTPLDELDAFNASHPLQRSLLRAVSDSVRQARRFRKITAVYGPSGVGKDRLIELLVAEFEAGGGKSPVVVVAPPEVGSRAFSMRELLELILITLGDPAPDRHTLTYPIVGLPAHLTGTEKARVVAVRNRLAGVNPSALIINEAGYLASGTPRQQASNIRNLTWLADACQIPIVIVGTYALIPLVGRNEDANRRIKPHHYPRYRDTGVQVAGFGEATTAYDGELLRLGLRDESFSLAPIARQLYDGSFGCVGLLSTWIRSAADRAVQTKRPLLLTDINAARALLLADATAFKTTTTAGEIAAQGLGVALADPQAPMATTPAAWPSAVPRGPVGERALGRDEIGAGRPRAKSA